MKITKREEYLDLTQWSNPSSRFFWDFWKTSKFSLWDAYWSISSGDMKYLLQHTIQLFKTPLSIMRVIFKTSSHPFLLFKLGMVNVRILSPLKTGKSVVTIELKRKLPHSLLLEIPPPTSQPFNFKTFKTAYQCQKECRLYFGLYPISSPKGWAE